MPSTNIIPYSGGRWQKGYGIGSVFRGLFRLAMPIMKRVGKKALRTGVKTGVGLATDALAGRDLKSSLKRRVSGAVRDMITSVPPPKKQKKRIKASVSTKRRITTGTGGRGRRRNNNDIFSV